MTKKNLKQKRKVVRISFQNKSVVESFKFQTHWGLKQLGIQDDDILYEIADVEVAR